MPHRKNTHIYYCPNKMEHHEETLAKQISGITEWFANASRDEQRSFIGKLLDNEISPLIIAQMVGMPLLSLCVLVGLTTDRPEALAKMCGCSVHTVCKALGIKPTVADKPLHPNLSLPVYDNTGKFDEAQWVASRDYDLLMQELRRSPFCLDPKHLDVDNPQLHFKQVE